MPHQGDTVDMSRLSDPIVSRFSKAQDDLILQAADLSLETIASMVESNAIDVSPNYQRRDRWSPQSNEPSSNHFYSMFPFLRSISSKKNTALTP
jgi:hypothetical protein